MRFSFGLEQKLVQKQVLAPRMIQSMEILQLPIQALEARIDQEMNENPLLEAQESIRGCPRNLGGGESQTTPTESESELVVDEKDNNVDDFERLLEMDQEIPDHLRRAAPQVGGRNGGGCGIDGMTHSPIWRPEPRRLQDALEVQLREMELSAEVTEVADADHLQPRQQRLFDDHAWKTCCRRCVRGGAAGGAASTGSRSRNRSHGCRCPRPA